LRDDKKVLEKSAEVIVDQQRPEVEGQNLKVREGITLTMSEKQS